jgi:hypothetical protein
MTDWSLSKLFSTLHTNIDNELSVARAALRHPGTKGNASEAIWINLLESYLPRRYGVCSAHVVDSDGTFSDQIDIVVFDRQYSPFVFDFYGAKIVPAESVYAVFEAKQTINAAMIEYARQKISSVRNLHRTSIDIPTAHGIAPSAKPKHIIGGLIALESDWKNPPLGEALISALDRENERSKIDLGCVAAHGVFGFDGSKGINFCAASSSATTMFLFELIARLQSLGTVPMMDVRAYSRWIASQ